MENIIEIKNLKKHFKEVKAVDDISFCVKKGELFAFLGLNGAGKSTTINIMCDELKKDSGQVIINGYSVDSDMQKIKYDLGVVFQNSVLDQNLSAYTNIKTRAMLYNLSNKEFNDRLNFLAEKLEFKDILRRPIKNLSGGQKRRIDIARALIHNPKILILDEPTTGLDPKTRILVWNLLNELRKTNELTIFLTTHYMEEASEADFVVILDNGKIVADDTPNNLKNNYAFDFVKVYNYSKGLIKILDKNKFKYTINNNILEIEVKNIAEAKKLIIDNANLITDFEVVKGKMDNVFLNVTGKQLKEF